MKRAFVCLLLGSVFSLSCSKDEGSYPIRQPTVPDKSITQRTESLPRGSPALLIKELAFSPPVPVTNEDITVEPVLADASLTNPRFQYRWFVNHTEVNGADQATLEKIHFKKRDWVSCWVKVAGGEAESAWVHSALLLVRSEPPEIEAVPVQEFTAPGLFRYQIRAKDNEDNELTYKLLAPLDAGIVLNSKTGLLQWPISPETLSRYGLRLEIQFEVVDPDGNRVSGTLTLNLTEKR